MIVKNCKNCKMSIVRGMGLDSYYRCDHPEHKFGIGDILAAAKCICDHYSPNNRTQEEIDKKKCGFREVQ